jgi:hypothetical protein
MAVRQLHRAHTTRGLTQPARQTDTLTIVMLSDTLSNSVPSNTTLLLT